MQPRRLPAAPDAIAPDGSAVRILVSARGGGLAHFELAAGGTAGAGRPRAARGGGLGHVEPAAGETSAAVRHRTVEELWYFVGGRGEMWRRDAAGRELVV